MKVLLLSGGSRGIGLATARAFAADGYRVVNVSRRPIPAEGAVQVCADLADPGWVDQHQDALQAAIAGSSSIVLVHNAGLLMKDSVNDLDGASLARALQVNVVASQQLNRLVLPHMQAGSAILYVGSTLSEKAVAGACSYVIAKHAVVGLMRATCQDLAGRNIHTACICPGFTDTEMLRTHVGEQQQILDSIAAGVSFGRLIRAEEIAATLKFCAANPVINGAVIHANLGQMER